MISVHCDGLRAGKRKDGRKNPNGGADEESRELCGRGHGVAPYCHSPVCLTVRGYLKLIAIKLDSPDRTAAVTIALKRGLLHLEDVS